MNWLHPALPPLLRGLGTSLLVFASLLVGFSEYRQGKAARAALETLRERLHEQALPDAGVTGIDALTRELTLLRLQLSESSLAGEVFANPWFQLLGALGTLMVAASFFVEAFQRRRPEPRAPATDLEDTRP